MHVIEADRVHQFVHDHAVEQTAVAQRQRLSTAGSTDLREARTTGHMLRNHYVTDSRVCRERIKDTNIK